MGDWRLSCTWPQKPVVVDPKASLLGAGCGAFPLEDRPPPIRVGTLHFLIPQGMHPGLCTQPVLNWAWSLRSRGRRPDLPGPEPWSSRGRSWRQPGVSLALPQPCLYLWTPSLPTELLGLVPRAGQSQSPGSYPRLAGSWFPRRSNPGLLWPSSHPLLESGGCDTAPAPWGQELRALISFWIPLSLSALTSWSSLVAQL